MEERKIEGVRKYLAVLLILGSGLFFSLMTAFIRMAGDLPVIEKAFFRNLVAAVVSLILLLKSKAGFAIKKGDFKYLMARGVAGVVGIVSNFYAIDHMLLADANMLNKLSPFFAILCSYFLLKEKMSPLQGIGVVVAFIGSLLVIKPSGAFGELLPGLIGLLGGCAAGIAYTFVRILGKRGMQGGVIVFFFSTFSCVSLLPFVIYCFQPLSWKQLLILLGAGVCAYGGQTCITKAYTYAPAKEISVYDYAQVIFSSILGYLLFGQKADGLSVLGYFIIIGMAVIMFLNTRRSEEKQAGKKDTTTVEGGEK